MMPVPRRSPHSISHPGLRRVSRIKGRTHVSTRPRATPLLKISLAPQGASTHVAKFVSRPRTGRIGAVFERLLPEPVRGVVNQLMQALVAGALFETIGDPRARPSLPGDMQDAGRVSLLEPRRRIKLDRQGIIGGMACGADHVSLPLCAPASQTPACPQIARA